MRLAEIQHAWAKLKESAKGELGQNDAFHDGVELDLGLPCLVFGGRNGAGKSRLLRSLLDNDPSNRVLINLHHLAEQALTVLNSRSDLDEMIEEYPTMSIKDDIVAALKLTVGREYSSIEWYALEINPSDPVLAEEFSWSQEQAVFPYFVVENRGRRYTSEDMGLGEFCVHFLFWILEQYRDRKGLLLLLDEPDAYLPPIGTHKLMMCLLNLCLSRNWHLMMSTHSEEIIHLAQREDAFVLLRVDDSGKTIATSSTDDPTAGDTLLANAPIRHVLFCEDESAYVLLSTILQVADSRISQSSSPVWGTGDGYLINLRNNLPMPPAPQIKFGFIFDGDQRHKVPTSKGRRWPVLFLPTEADPDSLFMTLSAHPQELAAALAVSTTTLVEFLDSLEGHDPHDWVNKMGEKYGRPVVLHHLANLWCRLHPDEVETFILDFKSKIT